MRYHRGLMAAGVLVLVAACCGCRSIREQAQDGLKKALPEVLGPAAEYSVKIDGPSRQLRRGRIARVRVRGKRVRVKGLPEFAEMQLDARDVVVDRKSRSVKSCGRATITATLTEAELTRMLNESVRVWKRKRVRSLNGSLRIEGWLKAGPVTLRGSSDYAMSVKKGVEIWMTPTKVSFGRAGVKVPGLVRKRAAAIINPVYTLSDDRLNVRLRSIVPIAGRVRLTGTFNPTGLHLE
jgi:hypothetical protein